MIVLGIDPGPSCSGFVLYDTEARCVTRADKAATLATIVGVMADHAGPVIIERPTCMGPLGTGVIGHLLDTAWAAGGMESTARALDCQVSTMTRRQVLRSLGVLSGTGSADSRVRAACIADHDQPARPAVGKKAAPGPLYGVASHAWQALGLVLAWLESQSK